VLTQQIHAVVYRASQNRQLKKGVKEATKTIIRGTSEFIVMAADTDPFDNLLPLRQLCEDKNVPYVFVPSKITLARVCAIPGNRCTVSSASVTFNEGSKLQNSIRAIKHKIERLLD
jgi:U4/U6 small nuclear ribonucleoprotein SNU13